MLVPRFLTFWSTPTLAGTAGPAACAVGSKFGAGVSCVTVCCRGGEGLSCADNAGSGSAATLVLEASSLPGGSRGRGAGARVSSPAVFVSPPRAAAEFPLPRAGSDGIRGGTAVVRASPGTLFGSGAPCPEMAVEGAWRDVGLLRGEIPSEAGVTSAGVAVFAAAETCRVSKVAESAARGSCKRAPVCFTRLVERYVSRLAHDGRCVPDGQRSDRKKQC